MTRCPEILKTRLYWSNHCLLFHYQQQHQLQSNHYLKHLIRRRRQPHARPQVYSAVLKSHCAVVQSGLS